MNEKRFEIEGLIYHDVAVNIEKVLRPCRAALEMGILQRIRAQIFSIQINTYHNMESNIYEHIRNEARAKKRPLFIIKSVKYPLDYKGTLI